MRRRSLIAQVALLGALGVLAFPSSSAALSGVSIFLTANGPSPAAATFPAGMYPFWINEDTVTHTVDFANGCSLEIAPGQTGQCADNPASVVGDHPYTVDGTVQASLKVTPAWRRVTLDAKRHGFRLGSKVRLHGTLAIASPLPPGTRGVRMPVTVLARPHGHHAWYRVAVVMAKPLEKRGDPYSVWQLWVRPHEGTTYMVKANSQPKAGQFWEQAKSRIFGLYVRRSRR